MKPTEKSKTEFTQEQKVTFNIFVDTLSDLFLKYVGLLNEAKIKEEIAKREKEKSSTS